MPQTLLQAPSMQIKTPHRLCRQAYGLCIQTSIAISIWLSCILGANALASFIPPVPTIEASSYLLMDASSGQILAEKNADQAIPPASLTKIMTSYVTEYELENGNISAEDMVPISVKAWKKGGSKMYVREGTQVKLIDLLRGIIIQSGNDASIAVAEYIAGSEAAFADLMNQHAKRLGMKNSNFVNATGWPAENHYSTAADLAILSRALIRDFPQHYSLYAERNFTYNGITQPNRNSLLSLNDTVDGIKTGHTEEAGYCLVASAIRDGMRLISVITGANSDRARASESQKLLTYGFRFYETRKVYAAQEKILDTQIYKGQSDTLAITTLSDVFLTFPRGRSEQIETKLDLPKVIYAPITMAQELGSMSFILEGEAIASQPLVAAQNIEQGGVFKRLWHSIKLFFAGLFK